MNTINEISVNEIDRYLSKKIPFIVRDWYPEASQISKDTEWEYFNTLVVKLPKNEQAVCAAASSKTHDFFTTDFKSAFDLIKSEKDEHKYYLFGNTAPTNIFLKIPWKKKIFFGNVYAASKSVRTKAHFDIWDIVHVQCTGVKTWWLAAPKSYPSLYPVMDEEKGILRRCLIDLDNPDLSKYPLFSKAKFKKVTVNPGDLLYVPPLWWHEVESDTFSISINALLPHKTWFYYFVCLQWYYYAFTSTYIYKSSNYLPRGFVADVNKMLSRYL